MPPISALTESAIAILDRLIAFDTVSRNSNLPLMAYVADYLTGHGIAFETIPSPEGDKSNIFATIGPAGPPGIVLSGHTDVVPVDGQIWTHDPFKLTRVDGKLYGRGTADMKGYVACILAIAPVLAAQPLRQPVHLSLTYDEETGCLGVPHVINHMKAAGLNPEAALVGEPSRMGVVNGHKGSASLRTRVEGLSCHSSRPNLGVSAILAAMDIIGVVMGQAEALAASPDSIGVFDPPYTTVTVDTIHGGSSQNAIPGDCRFEWDIRATRPGMVQQVVGVVQAHIDNVVLPAMRARYPASSIVTTFNYDGPPLVPQQGCAAEALARALTGANAAITVPYCSEAGAFQGAGIPTVICGPGDIAQAHTADEWIEVSQMAACMQVLQRLVERVAA